MDERLSLNFPELRAFGQLTEAGMERADATRVAGFSNSGRGTETAYLIRLEIRSVFVSTIPAEMRFSGPGMRFWSVCFARTSWIAFSRTWPPRRILPITTALAALYFALRYGVFPRPGDVPILDLTVLEDPRAPSSSSPARNPAHCSISARRRSNRSVRR